MTAIELNDFTARWLAVLNSADAGSSKNRRVIIRALANAHAFRQTTGQLEGNEMSDHVKVLEKAREEMVKARRSLAEGLAKPYDGRTTPGFRTGFLEVQAVIEQIDKAIADERPASSQSQPVGMTGGNAYR